MRTVFECVPGEGADGEHGGILTVGSAGWITGQSYMLMGPLLAAVRSVVMVGSPRVPYSAAHDPDGAAGEVHAAEDGKRPSSGSS